MGTPDMVKAAGPLVGIATVAESLWVRQSTMGVRQERLMLSDPVYQCSDEASTRLGVAEERGEGGAREQGNERRGGGFGTGFGTHRSVAAFGKAFWLLTEPLPVESAVGLSGILKTSCVVAQSLVTHWSP